MALQSSGAISISQIRTELGSSSYSLRTLSAAAGKGTPDAMSEFYGYANSHDVYISFFWPSYVGCYNYYAFAVTSTEVVNTTIAITMYWYGDLGGAFQGTVYLYSGNDCGVNYNVYSGGGVNCYGEYLSTTNYYFSVNSSGNQNYVGSGYSTDYTPC